MSVVRGVSSYIDIHVKQCSPLLLTSSKFLKEVYVSSIF